MEIKIGTILKNIRLNNGVKKYTQKAEGEIIGVRDTTISAYERNKIQPDFNTIRKVLDLHGYSIIILDQERKTIDLEKLSIDPDV